jgi:ABC-type antimicrobial peptide transport system permease subunit
VIAAVALVGLDCLTAGERASDLRTLVALGWPAHGVARLVAREAALLGLIGGSAAAVVDVTGTFAIVQQMPPGLLAAAAVTVGAGVSLSLVAVGLSLLIGHVVSLLRGPWRG